MTVLIIDPAIREGRKLKNEFDWQRFGVDDVITAYRETEVLSIASEKRPELIIWIGQAADFKSAVSFSDSSSASSASPAPAAPSVPSSSAHSALPVSSVSSADSASSAPFEPFASPASSASSAFAASPASSAFASLASLRSLLPDTGILYAADGLTEDAFCSLLRLGLTDFLKTPVQDKALSEALNRFQAQREARSAREEERRSIRYWKNNQQMIRELFWKQLCLGRVSTDPQEIEDAAKRVDAALDKDRQYRLILVTMKNEADMIETWGEDLCQRSVQNLARMFLKNGGDPSKVIVIYTRVVVILNAEEAQTAEKNCRLLAKECKQELLFYMSEPVYCEVFAQTYDRLLQFSKNDVLRRNSFVQVKTGREETDRHSGGGSARELSVPDNWAELLYTSKPERLVEEVEHYLVPLAKNGRLNERNIRIFQQDMLQLFFTYMEKQDMRAHELYEDQNIYKLYKVAILSIDGMCRWTKACVDLITGRNQPDSGIRDEDVVRRLKAYIRENLKHEIRISQLSEVSHLNADYTTRVFKRQTGMTIRDYIMKKRMELVKNLLHTTKLSISEIAMEAGYDNFSYLIRMFKKYYGKTPGQYRAESRAPEEASAFRHFGA